MSLAGEWVFSDEQLRNTPSQRLGLSQVQGPRPCASSQLSSGASLPLPPSEPFQENEDSMRRSGVALIADLVRMLEVCVHLGNALSPALILPALSAQPVVIKCRHQSHFCHCLRLLSPIFRGQRFSGHRLQSTRPVALAALGAAPAFCLLRSLQSSSISCASVQMLACAAVFLALKVVEAPRQGKVRALFQLWPPPSCCSARARVSAW